MHRSCKRYLSSSWATKRKDPVSRLSSRRKYLSSLSAGKPDKSVQGGEPAESRFNVREVVKARALKFRAEVKKMSPEAYAAQSLQSLFKDTSGGDSTKSLLESGKDTPGRQAEILAALRASEPESVEDSEDYAEIDVLDTLAMEDYSTQLLLNPGDLVEFWPDKGQRSTLVILSLPTATTRKRYVTLSERGSIDYTNPNRYRFVIPGFIPNVSIDPDSIILQSDAKMIPIRRALKRFKQETDKLGSAYARELAKIYDEVPMINNQKQQNISVAEVSKLIFGGTSQVEMYTAFVAMTLDRVHFSPDLTPNVSIPIFGVRTLQEVSDISNVIQWTRKGSSEFRDFVSHALEVVELRNKIQVRQSEFLAPISAPRNFTKSDQSFIRFMLNACLERMDNAETEVHSNALSTIVKALRLFPDQSVQRRTVHACLKKLGVLTPWDSNQRRAKAAQLPGYGTSARADEYEQYIKDNMTENQVEDLSKLGLRDSCESIRHDFGQLPVYTIDSEGAAELDDGISIDGDWLHVHIADPSSFISHDSKLAEIAQFRVETVYLTEKSIPMLPTNLTQRHFSLGSDGASPAMTTSLKLDKSGNISEMKIRPSVVRNVKRTTYDAVNREVFGVVKSLPTGSVSSPHWTAEGSSPTSRALASLNKQDRQNLKAIQTWLQPAFSYRFRNGLLEMHYNEQSVRLQEQAVLPESTTDHSAPVFYAGGPRISASSSPVTDSPAIAMVTEAAILNNRAIAQYATEHRIPIIYRSSRFPLTDREKAALLKKRDARGRVLERDLKPYMGRMSSSIALLHAEPVELLGLPNGYTHATSPLRRYVDMVCQWQLQSHLLKRPYALDLKSMLPDIQRKGRAIKLLIKSETKHWIVLLLQQQIEAGQAMNFRATVTENNPRLNLPSEAILENLRERCLLRREASDPVISPGSTVDVMIEDLDLMDNVIYTRRIFK